MGSNNFSTFFRPDDDETLFNPSDAIADTITAIRDHLAVKMVSVELNRQDECCIIGCKSALRSTIMELLENVYDEVDSRNLGGAIVWIHIFKLDDAVVVEVSDNCGGIEDVEKVFEPYYTTKGFSSGFGLGLFEVKILVEKYLNGSIEANNGKLGAKFTIRLNNKECK
jgi:C4-dicarboxylate-specific signal transduction histidine kinase